ncbi:S41 family peptidase [Ferruginibacter profundus]
MNKWISVIIINALLLAACANDKPGDPSTEKISLKKATEDFDIFTAILKSAHPSLNVYLSKKRFYNLTDSIRNSLTDPVTLKDFYNKINFITNETGCSHTNADLAGYVYDTLQNRAVFFPYPVKWIGDKLFINVARQNLSERTEIRRINNEPVKEIIKNLMVYNSVEGFHRKAQENLAADNFSMEYFLKYGAQEKFDLNVLDTFGKQRRVTENAISLSEWNNREINYKYYYDPVTVDYDFYINNEKKYAYLRVATFQYEGNLKQNAFENFCYNSFELLQNKKNIQSLIIDLRENTGGKLYNSFLLYSFLTEKPFNEFERAICKIKTIPYTAYLEKDFSEYKKDDVNKSIETEFFARLNNDFFTMPDSLIETWQPDNLHYKGNVFIITNSKVASAASYFAVLVKNAGRGKIIGEETQGGAFSGNGFTTLKYELPNSKINFSFPYVHFIYTNKEEKNTGHGLVPDYFIPDSYESFKNNSDRQLTFIIDTLILNNKSLNQDEQK